MLHDEQLEVHAKAAGSDKAEAAEAAQGPGFYIALCLEVARSFGPTDFLLKVTVLRGLREICVSSSAAQFLFRRVSGFEHVLKMLDLPAPLPPQIPDKDAKDENGEPMTAYAISQAAANAVLAFEKLHALNMLFARQVRCRFAVLRIQSCLCFCQVLLTLLAAMRNNRRNRLAFARCVGFDAAVAFARRPKLDTTPQDAACWAIWMLWLAVEHLPVDEGKTIFPSFGKIPESDMAMIDPAKLALPDAALVLVRNPEAILAALRLLPSCSLDFQRRAVGYIASLCTTHVSNRKSLGEAGVLAVLVSTFRSHLVRFSETIALPSSGGNPQLVPMPTDPAADEDIVFDPNDDVKGELAAAAAMLQASTPIGRAAWAQQELDAAFHHSVFTIMRELLPYTAHPADVNTLFSLLHQLDSAVQHSVSAASSAATAVSSSASSSRPIVSAHAASFSDDLRGLLDFCAESGRVWPFVHFNVDTSLLPHAIHHHPAPGGLESKAGGGDARRTHAHVTRHAYLEIGSVVNADGYWPPIGGYTLSMWVHVDSFGNESGPGPVPLPIRLLTLARFARCCSRVGNADFGVGPKQR